MQTWGVHTRDLSGLGWRGLVALLVSVGLPLLAAAAFGPVMAFLIAFTALRAMSGAPFLPQPFALAVLVIGIGTALAQGRLGSLRAGVRCGPMELAGACLYWSLLGLAFGHALYRLVVEPFKWDKTAHAPDPEYGPARDEAVEAGRQAA